MMQYSTLLVSLLVICVASLCMRLRIRNMRRARAEIARRRSLRSQLEASEMLDAIVSSYDKISVRIACDIAPAIEGIAKAFSSLDMFAAAQDLHDVECAIVRRRSYHDMSE